MTPRLPVELTDRIIDFLHSDKAALSACSLVCKTWLPSSRYHRSLYISSDNVTSFSELVESPVSTIAKYAPCLEMRSSLYILDRITPYLGSFATRSLVLRDQAWSPRMVWEDDVLKWCAKLTDVDIKDALFQTPDQFLGLLASLHSVETLAVNLAGITSVPYDDDTDYVDPGALHTGDTHSFTFPSSLRSIRIWLPGFRHRLSWFVTMARFSSVTCVTVCNITVDADRLAVRNLLWSLGSSVQTLHLEFAFQKSLETICNSVDLTHNTSLRSLYISGFALNATADRHGTILDIFSRITSLGLTRVTLKFTGKNVDKAELVWHQLSLALSRPPFASLQKVQIYIEYMVERFTMLSGRTELIDTVQKGMPDLHNRGILEVLVSPRYSFI